MIEAAYAQVLRAEGSSSVARISKFLCRDLPDARLVRHPSIRSLDLYLPSYEPTDGHSSLTVARATWAFVGLGLILRLGAFLLDFPLWWDEAFVAVNFLRRDYLDLARPLDYGQVGPLLFLWSELACVKLLGFSEWSLRLSPLLGALGSVVLFRSVASRLLEGRAMLLSVGVFAVSIHPIRHAADVKPYAADLLVALVLLSRGLAWSRDRDRASGLWSLVALVGLALLFSHPSVFILGGIGLATAFPAWRSQSWKVRSAWLAYGFVVVLSYATIYFLFTRPQAASASPGMRAMWSRSFPPLDSVMGLARWLGRGPLRRDARLPLRG